jgi:hypothetical protein
MSRYGVLLSLLLGLRPRACHPSACVRLGDLGGVAQINLVLKTVSYYPKTEDWQEPPGWWTLGEGTFHVFRSMLQGYESIDCRPLTVIWDYLPDWPWYPFMMELCEDYYLINFLYNLGCNSCLSSNGYFCWRKTCTRRQTHSKPNKAGFTRAKSKRRASQFFPEN